MESYKNRLGVAAELLAASTRTVAFTGAGISTESGLSDFRSPGGVWDRHRVVTFQEFVSSHESRVEYWTQKREFFDEIRKAQPNRAHHAIREIEQMGKLKGIITQNIDGFHQLAGNSPHLIVELHGTNRKANCLTCGFIWPIEEIQVRLEAGDSDPKCERCGGLVKPSTVSFGQAMPEAALLRAYEWATQCDLLLMIGSSLQVAPASSIPVLAHQAGARLIFVNRTETPWDRLAAVRFQESAGRVLEDMVRTMETDTSRSTIFFRP